MIEVSEASHQPSSALRSSFTAMLFKRKPVGSSPEKELRQRHRLSKPQTSKSSSNLSLLTIHQPGSQSTVSIQSETPLSSAGSTLVTDERRMSEKPRPVSTVQEEPTVCTDSGDIAWHGATVAINDVESTHSHGTCAAPPLSQVQKTRRPFSTIMFGSRRSSNSHVASRNFSFEDAPRIREVSRSSQSPNHPMEVVIEGAPRVLERRASFTPGAATRVDKAQSQEAPIIASKPISQLHREPSYELANADQLCEADKSYYYDQARSPISPLSQLEVLDLEKNWEPQAQIERSATPSDLDYHYLGGLRLGSLHVTNGRASPAPSEISRHLLHRPSALLRRDASSEYGSEIGSIKRTRTPPPSAWKRSVSREISQSRKFSSSPQPSREVSYGSDNAFTAQNHANGKSLPSPTADRTVSLAISYMAEMPNSPFSPQSSQVNSPSNPRRSSSPTGSVLVTTKKSEHEAELFDDEAVGESQGSEEDRDTISTCRTPSDAASHRVNPFDRYSKLRDGQSQRHLQPPQDARGETSDSGYGSNTSLQSAKEESKSKGIVAQRLKALEQPRTESAATQPPATTMQTSNHGKTLGPRPFRASLLMFHRKTAPESVPTMASFSPSTTSVATSQATTSTTSSRPKTPSKKLQKKRRSSQPPPPEEIMVTGARSGQEPAVPPIPQHQTANLILRSQQFPELQRTFKSLHHTKDSASSGDHSFTRMDIRFPSPPPEPASDEEIPRRSKFPSPKRDSFIARATRRQSLERQKSVERPSSGASEAQAHAIIQHFGSTANSLGGSPYDIAVSANSRPQSRSASRQGRITPHNITAQIPVPDRRRMTMDDRTASEFARSKSKSIAERDRQDSVANLKRLEHEKLAALNDRKKPRPYSMQPGMVTSVPRKPLNSERVFHEPQSRQIQQHDARPAQPLNQYLPNQQRQEPHNTPIPLTQRQSSQPEQQQFARQYEYALPQGQCLPGEQQSLQQYEISSSIPSRQSAQPKHQQYAQSYEATAPLPPRHSPRPSFVEPHDEVHEISLPPPPPSHSPRPMDLSTSEPAMDIWAAQAQAWKNRRKSVGEFLGFNSDDLHYDDIDRHSIDSDVAVVEQDLYPVIPPREFHTAYMPHEDHTSYNLRPNVWQPAAPHHDMSYEPDLSRVTPTETFQDPAADPYTSQEQFQQSPRPLPKPRSRRASGHSQAHSYASSLAEELHPDKDERPAPPPDFGRYSGGLQYGYEMGKGFGGSAGTRTASGKAASSRKGMPLSVGFGVDLSDVPIIAGMKRL